MKNLNFITNSINSISHVRVFIGMIECIEAKNNNYYTSFRYRRDVSSPNFYLNTHTRQTFSLSMSKKWPYGLNTNGQLSMRQDVVNNSFMPLSMSYLFSHKSFVINLSRNYNLPGLNDLYWPSGGNPDLKTEKSLQMELSHTHSFPIFDLNIKTYINSVNNWIQWSPQNNGLWSAYNQKKVLSRGIEIGLSNKYLIKKVAFFTSADYSFNKTTAIEHYYDKSQIGKQLIYIPMHKASASTEVQWKNHGMRIKYTFTGKRYDTSDNTNPLNAIHLLDLHYFYSIKQWKWEVSINNILNEDYAIIRYFPMPLRNLNISCAYTPKFTK
ncbi:MAG: TonB-dependent receptor [Saprospiraceae bacterium]|nr:TonB-dependent receptor [Saprospiraceae bacterium]